MCGSTGSLIGRSVAFVLLSAFDADDADSLPAGLHCGRYSSACGILASNREPQAQLPLLMRAAAFQWDGQLCGKSPRVQDAHKDELMTFLQGPRRDP